MDVPVIVQRRHSWFRDALFDSGYIFCVISRETIGRIDGFLREWVDSAPEVSSRPALLSSWPRTSSAMRDQGQDFLRHLCRHRHRWLVNLRKKQQQQQPTTNNQQSIDDVPMRTTCARNATGGTAGGSAGGLILFFPFAVDFRSRTSTFQFLVVEGEFLVFKVFFPDRVQQRCLVPWNAFLSGLWSKSLER